MINITQTERTTVKPILDQNGLIVHAETMDIARIVPMAVNMQPLAGVPLMAMLDQKAIGLMMEKRWSNMIGYNKKAPN